eukprot:gnl/Trimastix_PCT/1414.p1 GENE.gnl/Trimastix_PCT/1414~~gnl/Trimastix_PCT/1414.p1  ORF type:complete len:239 (-),score=23.68 gnl/Trimastix_PCT/1414:46-762(-)
MAASMFADDFETCIKVIVVGDGGVGKTSLIRRFCKGQYTDDYKKTIGVDFLEKEVTISDRNEQVRFMLWDTAGQEEFGSITRSYYTDAQAAVLAFSTTDRTSFEKILEWHQRVTEECGQIPIALIQTKIDLIDQARMTSEETEEMATRLGVRFYRTCSKENMNVEEVFMALAAAFLDNQHVLAISTNARPPVAAPATAATPPPPTSPPPAATTPQAPQSPPPKLEPTKRRGKDGCIVQ